ncbi:hypothetical protein OQH60_00525 [Campylobacter sp. MIT 21-1685]|uniref:hypothetical protein n=1 Tax=unclassified Campylobacter TaxID=2593542 RepID=UPI00224A6679|nr:MULTISPECIES: hypothetical protein [unclassified Campylobacter]MCX2682330.1 hypothetical protein [Campylobacter sp. MIT 21-1684]MCX2750610.1 hypothetical protein [Campylobacter sp. MIT 21-1682]MCX2806843.1 hypothetical protein [Campylobacter sp. MIT 21-1685]
MKNFQELSFNFLFKVSHQPVLLRDLLEANILFNEGMLIDPAKLNFRFKTFNAYVYYGILCVLILLPLLALTHYFFTKLDFHISIISAVFVTSCIFIGYDLFKIYVRKNISKKLIQRAWKNHFPCFAYEKYSKIVEEIYKQALKDEIPKANLENYVLEKIVHSK